MNATVNNLVKNAFKMYNSLAKIEVQYSPAVAAFGHLVTVEGTKAISKVTKCELIFGGKPLIVTSTAFTYRAKNFELDLKHSGDFPCRYILGHFLHVLAGTPAQPDQVTIAFMIMDNVIRRFQTLYTEGRDLDLLLTDHELVEQMAIKTVECENLREKIKRLEEERDRMGTDVRTEIPPPPFSEWIGIRGRPKPPTDNIAAPPPRSVDAAAVNDALDAAMLAALQ